MAGFYFSKIPVFKLIGVGVVGGKETLPPRLSITGMISILVATGARVVGGKEVLHPRPLVPSAAPIPEVTVPFMPEAVGRVPSSFSSSIPPDETLLLLENVR
ncbi:hypothetical protein Fot_14369 [Forsythia ovata]|uniref:Uncharacterized protein n=1 Tax=Forsythia ovata TaxID=205694 RepID=A0ABD1W6K4_9LAMI